MLLEREQQACELESEPRASDLTRPRLHISPPFGRLNDPNGLVFQNGVFHAFYQFTPLFPQKGVFWRHVTSENLLDWSDRGNALAPVDYVDTHGCYSGSGVAVDNGNLEFFYTGNVKDDDGEREPYQCLAVSHNHGAALTKNPDPLISHVPPGYTGNFRDPDVTERDGGWMMLLGAQRENGTGTIVRYDSDDRRTWRFAGEIEFSAPDLAEIGYMCECPILLTLTDEASATPYDVLVFCPQGVPSDGERFLNVDNLVYVVGHLTGTRFECVGPVRELDRGFEVYAPQAFSNVEDRTVLMLWLGNPRQDDQPSLENGWVHALSLPREVRLRDGVLTQSPVRELEERVPVTRIEMEQADGIVATLTPESPHVRIVARIDLADGAAEFVVHGQGDTQTSVGLSAGALRVDRSRTRYAPDLGQLDEGAATKGERGVRCTSLPGEVGSIRDVELVFDGSVLEIFVDGGRTVSSSRVFLGSEIRVDVCARGGARMLQLAAGEISA